MENLKVPDGKKISPQKRTEWKRRPRFGEGHKEMDMTEQLTHTLTHKQGNHV